MNCQARVSLSEDLMMPRAITRKREEDKWLKPQKKDNNKIKIVDLANKVKLRCR